MKKYGLIGHPIGHSTSPAVFNAGYQGRPYHYDLIEGDDFEKSYQRFLDEYAGINVTAPFKEPAFAKAPWRSAECERIGATNLLVKTEEGIKAYNSDYYGILLSILHACKGLTAEDLKASKNLLPARPTPEQCRQIVGDSLKTALIVGLGGAGKAAAVAALDLGLKTILMNRSIEKAEAVAQKEVAFAQMHGQPQPELSVLPISDFEKAFEESDIVIYNLPVALPDLKTLGSPSPSLSPRHPVTPSPRILIEANYRNPSFDVDLQKRLPHTLFVPGNLWHFYQAYAGYDLFTGEMPEIAPMAEIEGL